jgi:hypothetical protein
VIIGLLIFLTARKRSLRNTKEVDEGFSFHSSKQAKEQANFKAAYLEQKKLRNFDLALRYLFLDFLAQLSRASMINFHPDKTNREYAMELEAVRRKDFFDLSALFEASRYGHFQIEESELEQAEKLSNRILKQANG